MTAQCFPFISSLSYARASTDMCNHMGFIEIWCFSILKYFFLLFCFLFLFPSNSHMFCLPFPLKLEFDIFLYLLKSLMHFITEWILINYRSENIIQKQVLSLLLFFLKKIYMAFQMSIKTENSNNMVLHRHQEIWINWNPDCCEARTEL